MGRGGDFSRLVFYLDFLLTDSAAGGITVERGCPANQERKELLTMFDLIPTQSLDNAKAKGSDLSSVHHDVFDVAVYNEFASFEPVPVEAVTTDPNGIVEMQPMKYHALQNTRTNQVVDVVPFNRDTYNLTPHAELMLEQSSILNGSGLRDYLGNVEVCDRIYEEGLRVHRTIYFHDLIDRSRTRSGQQDDSRCRLDIFNSVDKSWTLQVFSGAYRDLCRNTLVFGGEKAYHQKAKHTKNMNTGALITKGVLGLEMWDSQRETMQAYRDIGMTEKQFNDVLIDSGMIDKAGKVAENNDELKVNQKKLATLLDLYSKETRELGQTMWAAFNALTHWSTHLPDANKGGRDEKKRLDKSIAVRDLVQSDAWLNHARMAVA